ncbi:MAG: rod shape-determining protein MreC [Bacteroidales bacterium]|nr:rod shape-determining protein MreC [Bacteroidales bacterium]MCI7050274.1 rod shape-determining protein MreC [Bacteroidales bacterium]MDD6731470.1 rod shape-determining protein MreC [Bacteroidales bacterium]MDY4558573.1 rod shape-determining protein MreC [Alloprevotella sp.]
MNNLLDFIRKYCYVLLFLLFETFSFVLLFRFNSYQGSVWFSAANSGVAAAGGLYDDVRAYLHLKDVNRELTDQNLALQRETELLRQALKDATKDSTVTEKLMHDRLKGFELIPATVVSNSAERADNYLVIDKGTQHGVRPEMGVVSGGGVVGIVYLAGPNYSLIIPVTNRKSSISCRVRGQNYFGYLQWDGQSMLSAYVDDVPRYAKVRVNQAVETSGYSAVFPPGIFVGRIRQIRNSADGQSYRLDITLGTNFANLRDVSVVATPYKAEIDTLQAHARQSFDQLQMTN